MVDPRSKRFERLLTLRQRQLDQKQGEAAVATQAHLEAKSRVDNAQADLGQAARLWRGEGDGQRRADEFVEAGQWLQHKITCLENTMIKHDLASERVRLTKIEVTKAEKARRQIEILLERLAKEIAQEAARVEQIEQDEMASRLTATLLDD